MARSTRAWLFNFVAIAVLYIFTPAVIPLLTQSRSRILYVFERTVSLRHALGCKM
jgi:hypothetical protein